MARFFNPRIGNNPSSAGAGKSFLMRRVRIRTLVDTLDAIYRFGGEFIRPGLIFKNLSAANQPILCMSNPSISGLIVEDELSIQVHARQAKSGNSVNEFITSLGGNVLTFDRFVKNQVEAQNSRYALMAAEVARMKSDAMQAPEGSPLYSIVLGGKGMLVYTLTNGGFVTTWKDGVRRNACEVINNLIDDDDDNSNWFVVTDPITSEPWFIFRAYEIDILRSFPGLDPSLAMERFVTIVSVCKHVNCNFNGSGYPRHVVIEGMTYPVIGGSVTEKSRFLSSEFTGFDKIAAYLDTAEQTVVMGRLYSNDFDINSYEPLTAPKIGFMLMTNFALTCKMFGSNNPDTVKWAPVLGPGGQVLFSDEKAKSMYWTIRRYFTLLARSLSTVFIDCKVIDNEVSVIEDMRITRHRFDLFKEWIVDPVGDTVIETLGQIWNRVSNSETTLKNGMSSGITRAFDAATGNAVWATYVNRGDPNFDPINNDYITGLESGLTFTDNDGEHLKPYVSITHRMTDRDCSHVWLRGCEMPNWGDSKWLFVMIDTPQEDKARRIHLFEVTYDDSLPCVSVFLGSSDAEDYLEVRPVPDANFASSALMPMNTEFINEDAVRSFAIALRNGEK